MAEYVLSAEITPVLSKGFTSQVKAQLSKALANVDANVKITGKLDTTAAKTQLAKFIAANRSDIKFKGVFDDAGLAAKVKAAAAKASGNVTLGVDLDDAAAKAKLRALQRSMKATLNVDADTGSATASLSRLKLLAAGLFAAIGGGGAVLPTVLAGGTAAFGALGGSAVGVVKALTAYKQEQDKATQSAATGASTALSSAIAIRNAQQSVDDARRNSARVAEQSGRSISDAQASVVAAEKDVAAAIRDQKTAYAQEHTARQQAIRDLEDLTAKVQSYALAEQDAQLALEQAQADQADLAGSNTKNALDQKDATLGLAQAQSQLARVTADATATELDRQVAALNVEQAQQRLNDVNKEASKTDLARREAALQVAQAQARIADLARQQTRDTEDLNAAQKAGIDGSQQVTAAKDAETTASERVTAAQDALKKAQTELSRTQQDAARQQEDAAIQVARAVQAVSDAQDRSAASGDRAAASNNKFAEAMAKLSPAAQSFVNQLLGMGEAWTRFQRATQTATLPGFTELLRSLTSLEGPATSGITAVGRELSDIAYKASDLLKNPLFQGRLEQAFENSIPLVRSFGEGVLTATDRLVTFAADNAQLTDSTAKAVSDLFKAVGDFYDNLQPHAAGVSRLIEGLGTLSRDVAGGIGALFGQISSAYAANAGTFEATFHELLQTALQFTSSALPALSNGLSVLADALRIVNSVVSPLANFLGGVGGRIAAAVLAFKLLSGAAGGVSSAFSAINPGSVAEKLTASKLGQAVSGLTEKVADSDTKTGKFASSMSKAGNAALSTAKYIPLLGVAIAGLSELVDGAVHASDNITKGFMQGGQAARDAAKELRTLAQFGSISADELHASFTKIMSAMSPLEQAQSDVTRTQNDLTFAVNTFGAQSPAAQAAADRYAVAQRNLRDSQWAAEQATKTHTDKIRDQQQAMLEQANGVVAYNSAMLRVQSAQQALKDATAQYGAQSLQAKQAQNDLESAMLGTVTAAGQLATAQTQGLPPSQQTAYQNEAINRQLAILSQQAGTTLPPALQQMVNGLKDSDVAAFGAHVSVDQLGNSVIVMPDGKTLTFPTNAADAKKDIDGLAGSVERATGAYAEWFRQYMKLITDPAVKNPPPGAPPLPLGRMASGGYVVGPGSGTSDSIVARLSNGEFVVNAAATKAHLPLLQAINQRYARGGLVGFAGGGQATTGSGAADAVSFTIPDLADSTKQLTDLANAVATLADGITANLVPAFTALVAADNTVLASTWALNGGMVAAWLANQNTVWSSTNQQLTAFGVLQGGMAALRAAMQATADWAVFQYGRVWAAAADPIRAVLIGPINAGLVGAWNSLDAQFALNRHVAPVPIPFATGGYVTGPGTGTSDSINARLSNGEYVIPAAITKRVRPFLDALRGGQGEALEAAGYRPGYATGGLVADTGSQLNATIARGLGWLSQQAGKPYIWGGVGPVGFDCSGLMSALTNVLRGESNPYHRLGVAESQPWPGFVPGLSSAFATGFNSHHTAGTLNGVNAEARTSGVPILVGAAAAGADSPQFTGTASLPFVGGRFVSGGANFDPAAIVAAAFQDSLGQADRIMGLFPGNVAANAAAGLVHRAVEAIVPAGAGILNSVLATTATAGSPAVVAAVRAVANTFGWGDGPEWAALSNLISGESGWNPNARNPTSSAAGLFQKMTSLHGPLEPTIAGQAQWGLSYIRGTYGDPINAWQTWLSRSPHWYDQGGYLPTGVSTVVKGTSKPEAVLDPKSTAAYIAHANALSSGGETRLDQYTINRLAAAIVAGNAERPIQVRTSGLGVDVAGV